MKTISTQLSYFLQDREMKRNLWLLLKYIGFLVAVVLLFTVLFHFIKLYVEGERYSWISGLYWTLTVMSTLGFGDITFQSDIGRLFSVIVLLSGIVMLLIVLPFAFIRFFYAPWLEAQIRSTAPRSLPAGTRDHVIICRYDSIAEGVISRLEQDDIPYALLEPDPSAAANLLGDGLSVVTGEVDSKKTYEGMQAHQAQFVLANENDVMNTNITLTVRESAPDVPIATLSGHKESEDILDLSGATHVLPVKRWLGEHLANRAHTQHAELHPIGRYENLQLAEMPIQNTPFVGKTVRETRLREKTGASVLGIWERGTLRPSHPDHQLTDSSMPVVIGTDEQLEKLNERISVYDVNPNPVLVIGGGTVGSAAIRSLHERDVPVHLIERDREKCERLRPLCEEVFVGDAADYELLKKAGVGSAPSVLLTTNDDAVNIYLASYCRRLNDDARIVSRITHERNLEGIHRAGADFVLSFETLGVNAVMAALKGKRLVVLGEGVDLFTRPVPASIEGNTLAESDIGARTGVNVVAIDTGGELHTNVNADTNLPPGAKLLLTGTQEQVDAFVEAYE